jgi:LysR family transcriptional regulator (chromosome initiation inhibitor)
VKLCFTRAVRFDPAQLETLVVITEEGTFEAAARRLHLTPSAVSQRIRALERAAGQVLVRRTAPASATPAGEPLVRLGRQLRLLAAETTAVLAHGAVDAEDAEDAAVTLAVAVNADSLASWFRPVLSAVAARPGTVLHLHVEDEGHSHDLLRRGDVLAAVTSDPQPVQGCTVEEIGDLRYLPAAAPALVDRHRHGHGVRWSELPMVVFNEKDLLQDQVLRAHRADRPRVVHRVPSTADFHEAVRRGLGWAMLLDDQLEPDLAVGDLVRLPGGRPVHVPLFWQRWRLDSPALTTLTDDVRRAARAMLRRPRRPDARPPG